MQRLSSLLVSTIIVQLKMGGKIMSKQFIGIVKQPSKVMLLLRLGLDTAIMLGGEYLEIMICLLLGIAKQLNKTMIMLCII